MDFLVPLLLLVLHTCHGQNSQQTFYFPDPARGGSGNGGGEVLGNFFNGNSPSSVAPYLDHQQRGSSIAPSAPPTTQQSYQPVSNYQPFGSNSPFARFSPFTNGASTSSGSQERPRTTHFFGNNYDFFRQFHLDPAIHGPTYQHVSPFQSFSSNGNSAPQQQQQQQPSYVSASPTYPSYPSSTSSAASFPPASPSPNSIFHTNYDNAANAIGASHGLRVITTETLKFPPVILAGVSRSSTARPTPTPSQLPTKTVSVTPTEVEEEEQRGPVVIQKHDTGRTVAALVTTPTPVVLSTPSNAVFLNQLEELEDPSTQRPPPPPVLISSTTTTTPSPVTGNALVGRAVSSRPLYNLTPGQLYHGNNNNQGFYNPYYVQTVQQRQPISASVSTGGGGLDAALEEIEPQVVELNAPLKNIMPLFSHIEEIEPFRQQQTPFNNGGFVRTSQYRSPSPPPLPSSPSPSPVVVVVTEGPKASPSPSLPSFVEEEVTSDISPTSRQVENIEVIRVGPKGRLLKKRRRKSRTQQVNTGRQPIVSESRPTTYHPPTVVSQDVEEEEEVIPTQRVSSRFRFSTTTTTPSPQTAASSADQNQLIASRLKSLERQIRFKNRSKST